MSSFFLVSGTDEFAIKARAREHIVELAGEDFENNPDLEIIKGDVEKVSPAEIIGQFMVTLNTPPFLSPRKVIWLKHFAHFKDNDELLQGIVTQLKNGIPPEVFVVIDGPDVDGRKAFAKAVKAADCAEAEFFTKADMGNRDYAKMQSAKIAELLAKHKKRASYDAMEFLVHAIGNDYGRALTEVTKLVTYVGDNREITLEDCRNIVSRTPEVVSWEFSDALTNGDTAQAFALAALVMQQSRKNGVSNEEIALVNQIIYSFMDIAKTRLAISELGIKGSINSNYFSDHGARLKEQFPDNYLLGIHPFRAFKQVQKALRFSDERIVDAFKALVAAHRALVSTGDDKRLVIDELIYRISG